MFAEVKNGHDPVQSFFCGTISSAPKFAHASSRYEKQSPLKPEEILLNFQLADCQQS